MVPEIVQLGYPAGDMLYHGWYLYPSDHWQYYQADINETLVKIENFRQYSKLVNS